MKVPSHGIAKAVLLSTLAALACSEPAAAPTERTTPISVPTSSTHTVLSSSYVSDAEMTMVDYDDGETYTLNLQTSELRRASDGAVLSLEPSQRDSAATVFASAIQNDPSIPDLEEIAASDPGTSPDQCTGMPDNPCAESIPIGADPTTEFTASTMLLRPVKEHGKSSRPAKPRSRMSSRVRSPVNDFSVSHHTVLARQRHSRPRSYISAASFTHLSPSGAAPALWLMQSNSMCTNLINQALPQTIDYLGKRNFAKAAFDIATAQIVDGVLKRFIPVESSAGREFANLSTSFIFASIKVGYIRAQWNGYNCSNKEVTAGPYYYQNHTYTQTPYGNNYVCEYQMWEISWDGGETWEPISVQVCKFEQQE